MPDLIQDIHFELTRKRVKYMRVRVCPPDGLITVSAPLWVPLADIRKFVLEKADWIEKHQAKVRARPKPKQLRYRDGEIHHFYGKAYALRLYEAQRKERVVRFGDELEMYIKPGATRQRREQLLDAFYRKQLLDAIPDLIAKYEPRMNVEVREFNVRKMRTRWGSCNIKAKRIWLSLELAKKPRECLEYVVVHEMVHLLEASHNARFWRLVERFMPDWEEKKQRLNARVD